MITVYGADWCEDTRRSLRHLRRLGVRHRYENIDEDLDALGRVTAITGGMRRTPTIDLGLGGEPLIEPDNDALTGALVEVDLLSQGDANDRLTVQNIGDAERVVRALAGLALLASARSARPWRRPLQLAAAGLALSGLSGWCPVYFYARVSSLGGPGDRPGEAWRSSWLAPVAHDEPVTAPAADGEPRA